MFRRSLCIFMVAMTLSWPMQARAQVMDIAAFLSGILSKIQEINQTIEAINQLEQLDLQSTLSGMSGSSVGLDLMNSFKEGVMSGAESMKPQVPAAIADQVDDPGAGKGWAEDELFAKDGEKTASDLEELNNRRKAVAQMAMSQAYGVAVASFENAVAIDENQETLLQDATNAQDARSNLNALTGLSLQIVRQLAEINALQASILETVSAAGMVGL